MRDDRDAEDIVTWILWRISEGNPGLDLPAITIRADMGGGR